MGVPCEGSARCEFVPDARRAYPSSLSCDLDGKLMQSVTLSPRSLTRKLDPQWQQSGSRRQMAMSCHENGLLVDADRLITFMHASTDRDLMHSAYLSAAKRALGMRSVDLVA